MLRVCTCAARRWAVRRRRSTRRTRRCWGLSATCNDWRVSQPRHATPALPCSLERTCLLSTSLLSAMLCLPTPCSPSPSRSRGAAAHGPARGAAVQAGRRAARQPAAGGVAGGHPRRRRLPGPRAGASASGAVAGGGRGLGGLPGAVHRPARAVHGDDGAKVSRAVIRGWVNGWGK